MKQLIYIPTKVEDELPEVGKTYSVSMDGGESFQYEAKGKNWSAKELGYTHFLKPTENIHLFTDSELLELKKKWVDEAFDKGSESPYKFGSSPTFINTSRDFHKQTFLNSIKLD